MNNALLIRVSRGICCGLGGLLVALGHPAWAGERGLPMTASAPEETEARVIVKYKAESTLMRALSAAPTGAATGSPQQARALSQRLGLSLQDGRGMGPRSQLLTAQGLRSEELAQRLAADSEVEYAVVDGRKRALSVPNDPLYPGGQTVATPAVGQWYLRAPDSTAVSAINAEAAWDITTGKGGIVVATIDTGVRPEHPDLVGKLLPGYDFVSNSAYANDGGGRDSDPSDPGDWITSSENANGTFKNCGQQNSSWHGTRTAGLIAAASHNAIGMAGAGHDVRLLPVRALGKCGGFDSDIIDAMRWAGGLAVAGVPTNLNKARVINMSLGGVGACSIAYRDAIADLTTAGVTVVVAAGNDGLAVGTPANCAGVVAVAGVRHAGTKVGYSDLGPEVTVSAPAGNCVNDSGACLYALLSTSNSGTTTPVASVYTTDGANASYGTSFSAPLAASTVALMLTVNPALTPSDIINALKASARAFPQSGSPAIQRVTGGPFVAVAQCAAPSSTAQGYECYCTTSTCGAGLLDMAAAVQSVATVNTANIYVTPETNPGTARPLVPLIGKNITLDATGSLAGSTSTPLEGLVRTLNATPTGVISSYLWTVTSGNATFLNGNHTTSVVTLVPTAAGSVNVSLTVGGASSTATSSTTLTVPALPVASISGATSAAPGATVALNGSASTAGTGLTITSYAWAITSGASLATLTGADTAQATLATTTAGNVIVTLTVTDSAGQQSAASSAITIATPSAASPTGGGGALGLHWLLALLAAVAALHRARVSWPA